MFLLYNLILTLLAPAWVPWMWWRAKQRQPAPNWAERQGRYEIDKPQGRKRLWFHAVSVGEVVASLPILRELKAREPQLQIVLTVTTSSGYETALKQAADLVNRVMYFPIDTARFQLAAMGKVRPDAVAIMETELWFNFLWAAETFEVPVLLVNGRISDRSLPRYQLLKPFVQPMLRMFAKLLVQSKSDAERFTALGGQDVQVLGNCKFDQATEGLEADPAELRARYGFTDDRPIIVIGSTRGELEEDFVVSALAQVKDLHSQVLYAPRHIERAERIQAELAKALGCDVARRSKGETGSVVVLDTYGELSSAYAVADVVIIGGGFDKLGGQNLIQALAHGKPVIHGPHMHNFRDVTAMSLAAESSMRVEGDQIGHALRSLLSDAETRVKMGQAARRLVHENLGASARYAEAILLAVHQSKANA